MFPELTPAQFLVGFALATAAGIAVFLHADKHGSKHVTAWGIGVFLFLGIMLPVYIVHVVRNNRRR